MNHLMPDTSQFYMPELHQSVVLQVRPKGDARRKGQCRRVGCSASPLDPSLDPPFQSQYFVFSLAFTD